MDKLDNISIEKLSEIEIEHADLNLDEFRNGERKIWSGHPSIMANLLSISIGLLLILLSPILSLFVLVGNAHIYYAYLAFGMFVTGILIVLSIYIQIKYTRYVLTEQAAYVRRGWIRDSVKRVPIDTVQSIEYSQGIQERTLRYGTIHISTASSDGTDLTFKSVSNPRHVHTEVNNMVEDRSTGRYNLQNSDRPTYEDLVNKIDALETAIEKKD